MQAVYYTLLNWLAVCGDQVAVKDC